ncbi:MAG: DegQ family serine endoprotease [Deltaproteobacteria bacterium]|nr:DegQ family serine endoprotease [Deltaproteobacteria bacterium]
MHGFRAIVSLVVLLTLSLSSGCEKKDGAIYYESNRKGTADAPVKEVPKDILATQQAFSALVKQVTPSVVNISTISKKKLIQPLFQFSPFFNEQFDGNQPRFHRDNSLGSGFIINRDGYILTNEHVIRDAEIIKVKLSNDTVYTGTVVGVDSKTDIAVIKIDSKEPLPVAVLADSSKLQVGQWAIAIGNPFGLDRTVTVGVVSATGRSNMGIETYEDFIQTDASINPGNSGGPLLNIHGEVIGINTAIVASGQGIGFAIPINMAKSVVEQLITKGTVSRGWLGVSIQPVTEDIASSFGLKKAAGALVNEVVAKSPADKAGLRQGDIIVAINSTDIKEVAHLQRLVGELPVGKRVELKVFRDGKQIKLPLVIGSAESAAAKQLKPAEPQPAVWLGMSVAELPRELRMQGLSGVIISELDPDGSAAEAGLQQGDIIVSINRKKIATLAEYAAVVAESRSKGSAVLLVKRGNASIYFVLNTR